VQRHARQVVVSPAPLAAVMDRAALQVLLHPLWVGERLCVVGSAPFPG
jgi:hypothetical protein